MSYDYQTERPFIFTDEGQRMFLRIRDKARELTDLAGAICISKLMVGVGGGNSWGYAGVRGPAG